MLKLILLFLVSGILHAEQFEIVKEHSKIMFEVDYMQISKVEGEFRNYQSHFELNNSQISNLMVEVSSDSIFTNNEKRDFHLKSHEFLFTSKYPIIKLSADKIIIPKKTKSMKFNAQLILHGISKKVEVNGVYRGMIKDPWGKENLFFEFKMEINRKEFGMNWNKELDQGGFLVGDKVVLTITVQAQKSGEVTAFSTHMIPATKGIIERDQLRRGKINKLTTSTK